MNINELNDNITSLWDAADLQKLIDVNSSAVRQWLFDNLSYSGRYSYLDGERFGDTASQVGKNFDFQDGWKSLTEEIDDVEGFTFGTGILYIDGELEINKEDVIDGDCYATVDINGVELVGQVTALSYNQTTTETDGGWPSGFTWNLSSVSGSSSTSPPALPISVINKQIGGVEAKEVQPPAVHSDFGAKYYLQEERNAFPWIAVINDSPKSISSFLSDWSGDTAPFGSKPISNSDYRGYEGIAPKTEKILKHFSPIER